MNSQNAWRFDTSRSGSLLLLFALCSALVAGQSRADATLQAGDETSSTLERSFDNDVARITRNVLQRFLDPKPFEAVRQVEDVNRLPDKSAYNRMPEQRSD